MHDQKLQKVVATSKFGTYKIAPNSVTVVTCALEAAVMFSTKLVSSDLYINGRKQAIFYFRKSYSVMRIIKFLSCNDCWIEVTIT